MLKRNQEFIRWVKKIPNKKMALSSIFQKYFQAWLNKKLTDSMEKFDYPLMKMVLCLGANPNIDAKVGTDYHLITRCARSGDVLLLETLLDFGGDVFGGAQNGGYQPIHMAAVKNHPDIIETLIKYGANVNALFELDELKGKELHPALPRGWTPIICACQHNKTEAVKVLLKNGANHLDINESGVLAIDIATKHKNREMILAIFNSYKEVPFTPRRASTTNIQGLSY